VCPPKPVTHWHHCGCRVLLDFSTFVGRIGVGRISYQARSKPFTDVMVMEALT
jgi:predicted membrane GTPase involved in stress response